MDWMVVHLSNRYSLRYPISGRWGVTQSKVYLCSGFSSGEVQILSEQLSLCWSFWICFSMMQLHYYWKISRIEGEMFLRSTQNKSSRVVRVISYNPRKMSYIPRGINLETQKTWGVAWCLGGGELGGGNSGVRGRGGGKEGGEIQKSLCLVKFCCSLAWDNSSFLCQIWIWIFYF